MFCEPGIPMPITRPTYEKFAQSVLGIIRFRESGVFIFPPKSDRLRRINQLLFDQDILEKYLPDFRETLFLILNPDMVFFEDEEELKKFVLHEAKAEIEGDLKTVLTILCQKKRLVFLVINAEKLFLERRSGNLAVLALQQVFNPQISIILFSESDITSPALYPLLSRYTVFCQNLHFIPLYDSADGQCFFDYLSAKWSLSLETKLKEKIHDQCRFYWLIKEAVRIIRDNPQFGWPEILATETMQIKIRIVWESLTEIERTVLKQIVFSQPVLTTEGKHAQNYLLKMKILKKNGDKVILDVPVLRDFLENEFKEGRLLLSSNGEILFNQVNVSDFFSEKEKQVLTLLINNENKMVSRQRVAKAIWGAEYLEISEWAIDQTISRLRKKLQKLGLPPQQLKTLKKQGFLMGGKEKC